MNNLGEARKGFEDFLAEHGGVFGEADVDLAIAALQQLVQERKPGAIRGMLPKLKPADPVGAAIAYLYVLSADSLIHPDKNLPILAAYSQGALPLARQAGELVALMGTHEA